MRIVEALAGLPRPARVFGEWGAGHDLTDTPQRMW
jgi:hypothetical protein